MKLSISVHTTQQPCTVTGRELNAL